MIHQMKRWLAVIAGCKRLEQWGCFYVKHLCVFVRDADSAECSKVAGDAADISSVLIKNAHKKEANASKYNTKLSDA